MHRLHILKRFADYLAESGAKAAGPVGGTGDPAAGKAAEQAEDREAHADGNPGALLEVYRAALARAYRDFELGTALDYRVFKVLKDHAPDAPAAGIPTVPTQTPPSARAPSWWRRALGAG